MVARERVTTVRGSRLSAGALAAIAAVAVATLWAFPAQTAHADIVVTNTGGKIRGEIIEEDEYEIRIKTAAGITIINREDIESIDRGQTPEDIFKRRFREIRKRDVEEFFLLAEWCADRAMLPERDQCWGAVVVADPENEVARERLGYEKVDGEWLQGDDIWIARGFVKHEGEWITHEDKARMDQGLVLAGGRWTSEDKAEAYRSDPKPRVRRERPERPKREKPDRVRPERTPKPEKKRVIELPDDDKALVAAAFSRSDEKRLAALEEIERRGPPLTDALGEKFDKEIEKARKNLEMYFKANRAKLQTGLAALLKQRRVEATSTIFDKAKYPDENHGAAGQPLVDSLVDKVKDIWNDPYAALKHESNTVKEKIAVIERLLEDKEKYARGAPAGLEIAKVEEEVKAEVNEKLAMKRFPVDPADRGRIQASVEVLAFNKSYKTSVNDEERACIDATNEYRMMMGKKALKIFEPLVKAARGHSQEMVKLGYFSHNSPVPANASPGKRASNHGASFTGENIAMGQRSGVGAFKAWYTSSGHHRNILGNHNSIGLGQEGHHWTQLFGADNPK